MEKFKSKESIPPEDIPIKENKSEFTKFNEQKAEEAREKIKGLMKRNEEINKENEKIKKESDNLST